MGSFGGWRGRGVAERSLGPVYDRVCPRREAADAQGGVARNENFGKIVLAV